MRHALRPYLGVFFALILALTGQSMAVARGMPDAAGQVILCTDKGAVTMTVDASGNPVGPPHICPDFAIALFAFAVQDPPVLTRPLGQARKLVPTHSRIGVSAHHVDPTARGPPRNA